MSLMYVLVLSEGKYFGTCMFIHFLSQLDAPYFNCVIHVFWSRVISEMSVLCYISFVAWR